jgi:glycosyltransferase involved in cell wall biosynthesis
MPLKICMIGSIDSIHTENRARALRARGHDVVLVGEMPEVFNRWEKRLIRSLSAVPKVRGLCIVYARVQTLARLDADIFHVQYAAGADAWLVAVAGRHPLVVSVWAGDVLFEDYPRSSVAQRLTLDLLAAADLITAESQRMLAVVRRLRPDAPGELIHWGIDLERFRRSVPVRLRARMGIPDSALVLYSPRILQPLYNIHVIVEALAQIKARHPEVRLLIGTYYQDPSYRQKLEELGARMGVSENLTFLPTLDPADVAAVYSVAALVISIPRSDGMPRTMMEAMACGAPLVLSRLPEYEEFVTHGESAYLTPTDPDAVASAVLHILRDGSLYERLRNNGLALAAQAFDERIEAARMEACYGDLLARPARRQSRATRIATLFRVLLTFGLKR